MSAPRNAREGAQWSPVCGLTSRDRTFARSHRRDEPVSRLRRLALPLAGTVGAGPVGCRPCGGFTPCAKPC